MNCHECNDQLVAMVEGLLDEQAASAVRDHIAGCADCCAEAKAVRQLHDRLACAGKMRVGTGLDQAVMDQILIQQVELARRLKMKRRLQLFAGSAIAAMLLISLTWAALQYGPAKATAAEIIARGAQAASNLRSVYVKCRMRTLPGDNFEYMDLTHDFVDVELWKQFEPVLKWRVEKPGRVAVMDGKTTTMVVGGTEGVKLDVAAPQAFDTGWIHRLAAIDQVLSRELTAVSRPGDKMKTTQVEGPSDADHQTVIVNVDTGGHVGEYLKNRFLGMSDTRREYTFDRKTGRLESASSTARQTAKTYLRWKSSTSTMILRSMMQNSNCRIWKTFPGTTSPNACRTMKNMKR